MSKAAAEFDTQKGKLKTELAQACSKLGEEVCVYTCMCVCVYIHVCVYVFVLFMYVCMYLCVCVLCV
jgi:hypothetical protein